jgi:hypothetical protein
MRMSRLIFRNPVLVLAAASLLVNNSSSFADDTPPLNPGLNPQGSLHWNPNPRIATDQQWEEVMILIFSIEPDVSFEEVAFYAESWFNLLPPVYTPPPDPANPTVVTAETWWLDASWLMENYFPCCQMCECELEMWVYILFNVLPPCCLLGTPAVPAAETAFCESRNRPANSPGRFFAPALSLRLPAGNDCPNQLHHFSPFTAVLFSSLF